MRELEHLASQRTGNGATVPFGGFQDIEAEGQRLLEQYKDADSQGRIYCRMAEIYAISGFSVTKDKVLEYAQKALSYRLTPEKRLEMLGYWGGAMEFSQRVVIGDKLAAVRREAVVPYLMGLKETLQYNLPDDMPPMPKEISIAGPHTITTNPQLLREEKLIREKRTKLAEDYRQQQQLIMAREELIGQIVYLYSRKPFANDEPPHACYPGRGGRTPCRPFDVRGRRRR